MADVFRNVHGIPSGRRMLLVVLADFANDEGLCWPSIKSLAENADLGERHVSAELKELAKAGYITIEEVSGKSNHYRIHPPEGMNHSSGVKKAKGMNHSSGVNHSASRTTVHPTPEPQFTPGDEPQFTQTINRTIKEPLDIAPTSISRKTKKVPSAIPDEFEVTDKMYEWAAGNGWSRRQVDGDTEQFRDYHRGKGSLHVDWVATWRTWMRNTNKFGSVVSVADKYRGISA